jgi:uncharacterized protein YndB with AHSA1/START domain
MGRINDTGARAVADLREGLILASMEVAAGPERVFRALTSTEITEWWVRPGVFDTREWAGGLRPSGRWRASGMTRGEPYVQQGEFLEIESPRWLVHTWEGAGKQGVASTSTVVDQTVKRFSLILDDASSVRHPVGVASCDDTIVVAVRVAPEGADVDVDRRDHHTGGHRGGGRGTLVRALLSN